MPQIPHRTAPTYHQGSSEKDIEGEPEWGQVPGHRVGFRDEEGRYSGLTRHEGSVDKVDEEFLKHARDEYERLKQKAAKGELLTVVDYMRMQQVSGFLSALSTSLA